MHDSTIYRAAGACGLLSIACFAVEIPLYMSRGPLPAGPAGSLTAYAQRNAANMLAVVLLDVLVCALVLVFLAGFRRLVREAQPASMWLATQVFGAGVVFAMVILFGDLLQGSVVLSVLTGNPDPSLIRAFLSGGFPTFGTIGLILSAALLAAASYVAQTSRMLPPITSWLGYASAAVCLLLAPFASIGRGSLTALAETSRWNASGVIAAAPIAAWMIVVGIAMVRLHDPQTGELRVAR